MLKFTPKTKPVLMLANAMAVALLISALSIPTAALGQRPVCKSVLKCDLSKKYINKIPIDGHPAGSVCVDVSCNGPSIRYFYREEGETCLDVYGNSAIKSFKTCEEFLTYVNGKKANRFFKKFKPDDFQKYTPSEVESSKLEKDCDCECE